MGTDKELEGLEYLVMKDQVLDLGLADAKSTLDCTFIRQHTSVRRQGSISELRHLLVWWLFSLEAQAVH